MEEKRKLFLKTKEKIETYKSDSANILNKEEVDYLIKVIDLNNRDPKNFNFDDEYNFFVSGERKFITTKKLHIDCDDSECLFICTVEKNYVFIIV